jgi:pimeloyl-ACP methyl ester carboxylesterase
MFGHSGGGQFVHRFVLLKPNARYNKAVAANSGWYTVPDGVANFPYGIMNCPITAVSPNTYFSRKLYVTVGALDNNGSDASLRHNTASDLQGLNRLDRANYFFSKSQIYANSVQATFNWQFHTVANSGHDATLMSNDAIGLLF